METSQQEFHSDPPHDLPQTSAPGRKKGTACNRCRSQKIRCDNGQGPCSNCAKVDQPCIRPSTLTNYPDAIGHIQQLEARLRSIENSITTAVPTTPNHTQNGSMSIPSNAVDASPNHPEPTPNPRFTPNASSAQDQCSATWEGSGPIIGVQTYDTASSRVGNNDYSNVVLKEPSPVALTTEEPSPAATTQITASEPLAHDVGLLSLANSQNLKYLGPSSGVPFARLILSAIPQSQGLPTSLATPESTGATHHAPPEPYSSDWTFDVDLKHFVDAYFDTHQPFYPFLDEDVVMNRLEELFSTKSPNIYSHQMPQLAEIDRALSPMHSVQLFLIIALGARILEPRLSTDFSSERYLATALSRIDKIFLHESMEGLQIMLLLALCSFYFVDGPNAWFLTANVIASCLDLGLQRQWTEADTTAPSQGSGQSRKSQNVRKGIFWSAYSLERTLAVVLGRPLTLRDEAIDVSFPGTDEDSWTDIYGADENVQVESQRRAKRMRLDYSPFTASHYSFRFDQLTAEMKLMLHRVRNSPKCFPWLADVSTWHQGAHRRCQTLAENMLRDLKWRSRRSGSDITTRNLELKYHHCIMLLHRPSPAIPRPSLESWKICYTSAVQTVLISADLNKFSKLNKTWLAAHTIFVSGMTFLYCLWATPEIKQDTSLGTFNRNAAACIGLLKDLGETWSVAASALDKFEHLVRLTLNSWSSGEDNSRSREEVAAGHSLMSLTQNPAGQLETQVRGKSSISAAGSVVGENNEFSFEPQSFYTELGDFSSWFDLDWMITEVSGDLGGFDSN